MALVALVLSLALVISSTAQCGTLTEELNALKNTLNATEKALENSQSEHSDSPKLSLTKINDTTYQYNKTTIELVIGNIVKQKNIDVIVNAAHSGVVFEGGEGGVAGAIAKALGKLGKEAFNSDIKKRYLKFIARSKENIGNAFAGIVLNTTDLGKEGYKYLICAVGPNCSSGENIKLVVDAYKNSLIEAEKLKATSIIFPRISAIIFGCNETMSMTLDKKPTSIMKINNMAIETTLTYLQENTTTSLEKICFIFFPTESRDITALEEYKDILNARLQG